MIDMWRSVTLRFVMGSGEEQGWASDDDHLHRVQRSVFFRHHTCAVLQLTARSPETKNV